MVHICLSHGLLEYLLHFYGISNSYFRDSSYLFGILSILAGFGVKENLFMVSEPDPGSISRGANFPAEFEGLGVFTTPLWNP